MYNGVLLVDMVTILIWSGFKGNKIYKPYFTAYFKGYETQRKLTVKEKKYFKEILKFRLLREAFIGEIPDDILWRPKKTFQVGCHTDFLQDHKELMSGYFNGLFDKEKESIFW